MKPGRVSGSPQDGAGIANSLIILNTPITRPTMRPQNAPGSLVNSVKIPITKTVTTGGPRYDVIALTRDLEKAASYTIINIPVIKSGFMDPWLGYNRRVDRQMSFERLEAIKLKWHIVPTLSFLKLPSTLSAMLLVEFYCKYLKIFNSR